MEVNGFIILANDHDGFYPNRKDYLVFHPMYDGFFRVYDSDTLSDATKWCEEQDFNEWSKELSEITIW